MALVKTSQFAINLSWFGAFLSACFVGFFWALLSCFLNNASWLPITVDKNSFNDWKLPADQALIWNLGMIATFGICHSAMISQIFKLKMAALWGGFAVFERTIFLWVSVIQVCLTMIFYQPLPTVIVDFYSPVTLTLSYLICAVYIVGLTWCNVNMGKNDLFGLSRFEVIKPEGFEHPFNMPFSTHWIYSYVQHPLYCFNAMFMLGSGTVLTQGALAFRGGFFAYNFIGALIETWRNKELPKETKTN